MGGLKVVRKTSYLGYKYLNPQRCEEACRLLKLDMTADCRVSGGMPCDFRCKCRSKKASVVNPLSTYSLDGTLVCLEDATLREAPAS